MATTKTPARRRSAAATDTATTEPPPAADTDTAAAQPAKAAKTARTARTAKAARPAEATAPAAAKKTRATAATPAAAPGKPAKPAKPAKAAESAESAESAKPAEAVEPAPPAKPTRKAAAPAPAPVAAAAGAGAGAGAAPAPAPSPAASAPAPAPAEAPSAPVSTPAAVAEPVAKKAARPRGRSTARPEVSPVTPEAVAPVEAAPPRATAARTPARKKPAGQAATGRKAVADQPEVGESPTTASSAATKPATRKPATRKPARRKATAPQSAVPGIEAGSPASDAARPEPADTIPAPVAAPAQPARPAPVPAPLPEPTPAPIAPTAPTRPPARPGEPSRWQRTDGDRWRLQWHPGDAPAGLHDTVAAALDAEGTLSPEAADALLPQSLRLAAEAGHRLEVDPAIWPLVAADRDHRTRAAWLAALYPDGPASPALAGLLTVPLVPFQAEGALWSVVAGRGLLADEPGLGKGVQAIAAARLWQRHFGLERVLVLCAPGQRLGWQQAWRRLAGEAAQVLPASPMQRGALWGATAAVRILSPEALASDAAALAEWAPQLAIVDEPQRLGLDAAAWQALAAVPQLLVLCGAALDADPALLEQLIDRLDPQRLGPYAAWATLRAAREAGQALDDAALEAVSDQLSRVLLQRQRAELAEQLPPVIHATRWTTLDDAQRAVHDAALAQAGRLLAGWQRSGYLADADQWLLSSCLVTMQQAALRADPARADSPLAESVVRALAGQLDDWTEAGEAPVLLRCDRGADAEQLRARLGERPGLQLLAPGERPAGGAARVLQLGAPWRLRRDPLAGDGQPGQHWVTIAAADSLDQGLIDTLAQRGDAPRGPAEPGARGFLAGERLQAWLQAVAAALAALHTARTAAAG